MATHAEKGAPGRAILDLILIVAFLAAIYAPLVDERIRPDEARGPAPELRLPAPKPSLSFDAEVIHAFPERYEAYYADTFGLRDKLLRWHSIEKLFLFDVSPTSKVILGQDDWMFYTGDFSIEAWRGMMPLSPEELEAWRRAIERHRDHLRDGGVEYMLAIAPNKEAIYPEHMPARINPVGPTRLDQIAEHMRRHSDVRFLDLRRALLAEKAHDGPDDYLYFAYGTHWNGRGAWVCYREILRALQGRFPALRPKELTELRTVHVPGHGDTWGRSMYVYDLTPQKEIALVPDPAPRARTVLETDWGPKRKKVTVVDDPTLPRAMLLHDSFGPYIEQVLAEHFSRLACEWRYDFDTAEIAAEKPDVVIELWVERALVNISPDLIEPTHVDTARVAFQRSRDVRFALDPTRMPPEVTPSPPGGTRCRLVTDDSGSAVEIRTATSADLALLPPIDIPAGGNAVLWLDLTSPIDTTLLLFYKLDPDADYDRRRCIQIPIVAGRNQLHVRLDQPGIRGRLAMRPGSDPGSYLLRAFEIRAAQ